LRNLATSVVFFLLWVLNAPVLPHHSVETQSSEAGQTTIPEGIDSGLDSNVQTLLDLLSKNNPSFSGSTAGEFLDPDKAFLLTVIPDSGNQVSASWDIAQGYYLYRDKFDFSIQEPKGITIGSVVLPPGEEKTDEFFGKTEVFHENVKIVVPVHRSTAQSSDIVLNIRYQGCADAGLCYPPIDKQVSLVMGLVTASNPTTTGSPSFASSLATMPAAELTQQDQIVQSLLTGNTWLVMLSFFGFGLLLCFTPCVLPMLPILSGIIVGQGDNITTGRAFSLSLVYVLAMAATYTIAGVITGILGANLQALFQNPWILAGFSGVFVAFAMSMFGFYDLQLPAQWQTRLVEISGSYRGGTYIGVTAMGVLSALIVGPCIAAPLAGALIYIGQTGDPYLGGFALFSLSLGMGAPLLLIGTSAGKVLPKVGPWMDVIKWIFGLLLLAVAVYLLERIIPGWLTMLLVAGLSVLVVIKAGATLFPDHPSGRRQLILRLVTTAAGLYTVALLVGAGTGSTDVIRPLDQVWARMVGDETTAVHFKRVKGPEELNREIAIAKSQGRAVLLDYYADWCISCKQMERNTFSDKGVQNALADTLLLQTDVTNNDTADKALLKRYGLFGPPAILFFDPDGRELRHMRVIGYMDAETFRAHILKVAAEN